MTDTTLVESNGHETGLTEQERGQYVETLTLMQERLAELELALEDTGWLRMTIAGEREFSREGLRKLTRISRLSFLKNPLINHATRIQADYVWAQGATFHSPNEQVNGLIQKFLDDRKNKLEFTGHQSRTLKEIELQIHGNLFIAMYTNPSTGRVLLKAIPMDEVIDIITNPDDASEPWFYKRAWSQQEFDPTQGEMSPIEQKYAFHPDWQYAYHDAYERPTMIGEWPVLWEAPIYHVRAGGFSDQRFGVPEIYSSIDWARAVKSDLEDYATIRRALARFAWSLTTKGGKAGVAAAKSRLGTTLNQDGAGQIETNPSPVAGSTWVQSEGWKMEPMKTAGMAPSPDEGRRLWLMVAAGTGIPETILSGDADVGNLATAKTLDRPTELKMRSRQTLWADIYYDMLNYVVDQAVIAMKGPLAGTVDVDEYTDEKTITLDVDPDTNEPASRQIDISFPNVLQRDALPTVQAIVQAGTLNGGQNAGLIDDRTLARLLLSALGEEDVDQRLQELFPENFLTTLAGKELPDDTQSDSDGATTGQPLPKPGFGSLAAVGGDGTPDPPPTSTYPNKGFEARRRAAQPPTEFREALGLFRHMLRDMMILRDSQVDEAAEK